MEKNMSGTETESRAALFRRLREPFEKNQISKLPKPYKKDSPPGKCAECGGYHGLPALHLDYVGHAATTDRLLEVDPAWNWEPVSVDAAGMPALDKDGGLWIRLTILGVTRLGYGDAQGKTSGNATKERIGDAIRNAAMRFGVALDLWHKGILHMVDLDQPDDRGVEEEVRPVSRAALPRPELEECTAEKFETNKAAWKALITSKKKTPASLISFLGTKLKFTEDQKMTIDSWAHEND